MRVQLEVNGRSVDLEDRGNGYYQWEEKEKLLELVSDALFALGYTEKDLLEALERKGEEE